MRNVRLSTAVVSTLIFLSAHVAFAQNANARLGPLAREASKRPEKVQVILRMRNNADVSPDTLPEVAQAGGRVGRRLSIINARVIEVSGNALEGISHNPNVEQISLDRPVYGAMERTATTIGASAVRQDFGLDGAGIGVAVIDSGVTGVARRPGHRRQRTARRRVRRFRQRTHDGIRRLRPRHACGRHHRRRRFRLELAAAPASRLVHTSSC